MIATIGTDPVTGVNRFTFGSPELLSGIPPILVMVGLFADRRAARAERRARMGEGRRASARASRFPSRAMWRRIALPQAIGSVMGTFEGIMPGGGGTISAFLAYNEARRWSRHKEEFGHGSPEGIAAPEAANNTVACTALVPMLSLGIPELELLGGPARRLPDSRADSRADAVREESGGRQRPLRRPARRRTSRW